MDQLKQWGFQFGLTEASDRKTKWMEKGWKGNQEKKGAAFQSNPAILIFFIILHSLIDFILYSCGFSPI